MSTANISTMNSYSNTQLLVVKTTKDDESQVYLHI